MGMVSYKKNKNTLRLERLDYFVDEWMGKSCEVSYTDNFANEVN